MAVSVVGAFVVAVATCPLFARLAIRTGIVDRPGPLKVQRRPVPYLGGLAVLAALAVPTAVLRPWWAVPMVLASALGLRDDSGELPASLRLALEVVIALCAAAVGPADDWFTFAATVVFVLVLINAVNLLDGLDALASGVTFFAATGFAILLAGDAATIAAALAAALAGVLVWNRPPARIYLGDAGTYLLGVVLALLLATAMEGDDSSDAVASLLFVAVPVADTTVAILRRWRARKPLFAGDRGHVYDQLVDRGWSAPRAVVACIVAQAAFVVLGLSFSSLPPGPAALAVGGVVVAVGAVAVSTFTAPARWQG